MQGPLEEVISSQISPWPDLEIGEAAGDRNPAPAAAGGEGDRGTSKRAARATSGWPRLSAGRPEAAPPRSRASGGGERVGEHQRSVGS